MSHTPGPWFVECQSGGAIFVQDEDGLIADVWDNGQMVDNAQLIAAAPDLLALARRVHAECGPCEWEYSKVKVDPFWECQSCDANAPLEEDIDHNPNCLWLAAEAALTKAGAP